MSACLLASVLAGCALETSDNADLVGETSSALTTTAAGLCSRGHYLVRVMSPGGGVTYTVTFKPTHGASRTVCRTSAPSTLFAPGQDGTVTVTSSAGSSSRKVMVEQCAGDFGQGPDINPDEIDSLEGTHESGSPSGNQHVHGAEP